MRLPYCTHVLFLFYSAEKFSAFKKAVPDDWCDERRYPAVDSFVSISDSEKLTSLKAKVTGHQQPTEIHFEVGLGLLVSAEEYPDGVLERSLITDGWNLLKSTFPIALEEPV